LTLDIKDPATGNHFPPILLKQPICLYNYIGIILAKELIKELRKKGSGKRLNNVWIGGGGNKADDCQEMTRRWLVEEVCTKKCASLLEWKDGEGWVKVL
jgi:hypothetical protein